jgi:ribonuclease P protein component
MSEAASRATFQREERVRRREDFQRVYDLGTRHSGRYGTMVVLRNGLTVARLGIAASRKFGKAVARNRAKRLIRDVFRRNKIAPGFDIVVIPRRALLTATLTAFEAEFRHLLQRRHGR